MNSQKIIESIKSIYENGYHDNEIYYQTLIQTFRDESALNDRFVETLISNSLNYCLRFVPLHSSYSWLNDFDPLLILHIVGFVADDFEYNINSKKEELLVLAEKVLTDEAAVRYHLNCFYPILHLFIKIDDERFLNLLDKYIGLLSEENFFGGIGEELFLYFDSHRSQHAQEIKCRYLKHGYDRLKLYLE